MIYGISFKAILIGILVVALLATGGYIVHQHQQAEELKIEKQKNEELIQQYRQQEAKTIVLTNQKQTYAKKVSKTKKAVYEETNQTEYAVLIPESSSVLINTAIDEANSYISSSK